VVSPREAELAKLFNNAYRYIEFAAANQFYLIARAAGLDYRNIYDAMKCNYPRAGGIPTPGFAAGPSLIKDTAQLAAFAQNQFSLGNAAMLVNAGLVLHICDDLRQRYNLTRMTVGLLGMAFKADIDDTRASLSYKFKKGGAHHRSVRDHASSRRVGLSQEGECNPVDSVDSPLTGDSAASYRSGRSGAQRGPLVAPSHYPIWRDTETVARIAYEAEGAMTSVKRSSSAFMFDQRSHPERRLFMRPKRPIPHHMMDPANLGRSSWCRQAIRCRFILTALPT
jgi:hypothetical protein